MQDLGSAVPHSACSLLRWSRPLSCAGGLAAVLGLLACDSGTNNLLIAVTSLPQRAVTVSVLATLNDKAAQSPMDFTQPLDRLGVALPQDASGHLVLDLTALDSDRCTQGTASVTVELPSQRVSSPLAAEMTAKSPRQCGALAGCAANTLCPLTSPPQKSPIFSLWAISPSDIWAAGGGGTLMHFDGGTWSAVPSGVSSGLSSLWGSSSSDVWAVGAGGKILHYNGTSWSQVANGAANDLNWVWGIGANNVWAVGENDTLLGGPGEFWHWDGANWTKVTTSINGPLYSVWASSPGDIFACGAAGLIMHYDTKWTKKASGTANDLFAIWGSAPNQVFAAGKLGTVVKYDGTLWKTLPAGTTTVDLNAIFGDGKTVYIVGNTGTMLRSSAAFDSFTPIPSTISTNIYSIQLGSNGINWLGGSSGTSGVLLYFDTHP